MLAVAMFRRLAWSAFCVLVLLTASTCSRSDQFSSLDDRGSLRAVPVAVQLQAGSNDCGLAVLAMVLTALGQPTGVDELRQNIEVPTGGLSMLALQRLAADRRLFLSGIIVRTREPLGLKVPWIAHLVDEGKVWQHYVVVEQVNAMAVRLVDPNRGRVIMARNDFRRLWSGKALVPATSEE